MSTFTPMPERPELSAFLAAEPPTQAPEPAPAEAPLSAGTMKEIGDLAKTMNVRPENPPEKPAM